MSKHFDPNWLRQKYIVEGLSTYEMAALVGRDAKSIYTQLRKHNIPTRPRGTNLKKGARDNYVLNVVMKGGTPTMLGKHHSEASKEKLRGPRGPNPKLQGRGNGMYGRRGELNPNYRGGICPERQRLYATEEGKKFLRTVLDRDDHQCVRCGAKYTGHRSLHVHHIGSWDDFPDQRLDPDNAVTLCTKCHGWTHSKANIKSRYRKIPRRRLSC